MYDTVSHIKQIKVILFLSISIYLLFLFPSHIYSVGLPPPPSKETLDSLKQMGDENLARYGDGGVTLVNSEYVINPKINQILPTSTPTPPPTSTPMPKPTLIPTPQPASVIVITKTKNIFVSIWHFFQNFFMPSKK